jgi:hypothetical protein
MRRLVIGTTALIGLAAATLLLADPAVPTAGGASEPAAAKELIAGDPAPRFSLQGSDGRTYRLEDYLGKRAVVIAWFPKAFTGG